LPWVAEAHGARFDSVSILRRDAAGDRPFNQLSCDQRRGPTPVTTYGRARRPAYLREIDEHLHEYGIYQETNTPLSEDHIATRTLAGSPDRPATRHETHRRAYPPMGRSPSRASTWASTSGQANACLLAARTAWVHQRTRVVQGATQATRHTVSKLACGTGKRTRLRDARVFTLGSNKHHPKPTTRPRRSVGH